MTRRKAVGLLGLLALLGAGGYWYAHRVGRVPVQQVLRATGTVEGVETSIASKIAGRIRGIRVREGDRVKAGDLLVEIEPSDLEAAVRQARAGVGVAEASLRSGVDAVSSAAAQVVTTRAEVEGARAALGGAEARLAQSERDLARARELFDAGLMPRSDLEKAQTDRAVRTADVENARAALAAAGARTDTARTALKKAQTDVAALQARIVEAREATALASVRRSDAEIRSPGAGLVAYRALEPGEVVAAGTSILTLVAVDPLWVRVDLEQRSVEAVRVGTPASVTLEGRPGRAFAAQVMEIGAEGEFAVQRDVTRGRQDIKTFRTRLRLLEGAGLLKPGMTVLVAIPVGPGVPAAPEGRARP